ncbi:hypothetical protein HYZ80_02970 [Candidatus Parcubacteria bacterium]|nr:hypothetical protein [Candidatus Parcubacteria bacterium]
MHCLQAAVMMMLNTLDGPVSWEEVNAMTKYEEGKYSWTPVAAVALAERIPGVKMMSNLDYHQLADRGEEYLREYWNPAWYQDQKQYASAGFAREQQFAKALVAKSLFEHRRITTDEIERLVVNNLLIAVVNANKLAGEPGAAGHFVVIYEDLGDALELHDPGLPPRPEWQVDKNAFMAAFQNEAIIVG